jgi:TetR/AcrR family transcriptional regulator, tetracycline repressor protein
VNQNAPAVAGDRNADRPALTQEQVVRAAIALIDDVGLEALTMRKLAKHLEVYPAALYWHAGSKPQLLDLVYRTIISEIDVPPALSLRWDEWITSFARAARAALGHHPDIAANFSTNIQTSASSFEIADTLIVVLERAGFRDELLLNAYNTVLSAVFGWIAAEYAHEDGSETNAWRTAFQDDLRRPELREQYPAISRNIDLFANRSWMLRWESGASQPMRRQFDAMLQTMITGLKKQLTL